MSLKDEWAQAMGATRRAHLTITARLKRLEQLEARGVDPVTATTAEINTYLNAQRVSDNSLATYRSHLEAWYKWLLTNDHRADNPMLKIDPTKHHKLDPDPLEPEHIKALEALDLDDETRMMSLLAMYQGFRVHEIAKVRGSDVDLVALKIKVVGKGKKPSKMDLHPKVAALAATFPKSTWWFPSERGEHLSARSVSNIGLKVMRSIGVNEGGWHRLRHVFGTRLQQNGNSLLTTQTLMRHDSPASTSGYAKVGNPQLRKAIEGLE